MSGAFWVKTMTTTEINTENTRLQLVRAKLESRYGGFASGAKALLEEINSVNIAIANNWARHDDAKRTLRKASLVLKYALEILDDAKYVEQRAAAHLSAIRGDDCPAKFRIPQHQRDKVARAGYELDQASTATSAAQAEVDAAKASIKTLKL